MGLEGKGHTAGIVDKPQDPSPDADRDQDLVVARLAAVQGLLGPDGLHDLLQDVDPAGATYLRYACESLIFSIFLFLVMTSDMSGFLP